MKFKPLAQGALIFSVIFTPLAYAKDLNGFEKTADAVEYRQKAFSLIRHQFGQMRAMMKGKVAYDQAKFSQRADNLAALALLPWEGFIKDSDIKTLSGKTSALPSIWQDPKAFEQLAQEFKANTAYLAKVSKGGDKKEIKAALNKMGKRGCKACHKRFKD